MDSISNSISALQINGSTQIEQLVTEGLKTSKGVNGGIEQNVADVANEFESVFLSLLLKEMRNTLDSKEGGLFGGEGSDTYGGMFDMFMGKHLADSKPLGIANAIEAYMGNQQ